MRLAGVKVSKSRLAVLVFPLGGGFQHAEMDLQHQRCTKP